MLGTQLARFSSAQGLSLLITNILHYASIAVVASMLGPSKLGSYALLFFLTGLVTQVIHLLSKPGTMMRTFGVSDDDDDAVEEDDDKDAPEEASTRPSYTLGVGMLWTIMLAVTVSLLVFAFRTPIAAVPAPRPRPGRRGGLRDDHRAASGRSSSSARWSSGSRAGRSPTP